MSAVPYLRLFPEASAPWDEAAIHELAEAMLSDDDALWPDRNDGPIPAGYTYLGQLIAHDLSFEVSQALPPMGCPNAHVTPNRRRRGLNLDSVYGGGPKSADRHLYQRDGIRFRLESKAGGAPTDLCRRKDGSAWIADPRNEATLTLAQLHLALMVFHNRVADHLEARGATTFEMVRETVVQHVQSVVLHDYLWQLMPDDLHAALLSKGPRLLDKADWGRVPLEFSHGAFRFGHSMVRGSYGWGRSIRHVPLPTMFDRTARNGTLAQSPLLRDWQVQWEKFFDCNHLPQAPRTKAINRARRIGPTINRTLAALPAGECAEGQPAHLPLRDLARGVAAKIPPAQQIIALAHERRAYITALQPAEILGVCQPRLRAVVERHGFAERTPLWLYVLVEAAFSQRGEQLGALGALIVGDSIYASIASSPYSILARRGFKPRLPSARRDMFSMPDLLRFAGLV